MLPEKIQFTNHTLDNPAQVVAAMIPPDFVPESWSLVIVKDSDNELLFGGVQHKPWIRKHVQHRWMALRIRSEVVYAFEDEEEAVLFKLSI